MAVLISLALPWAGQNLEAIAPLFEKDPFAQANLQAEVAWGATDYLPGAFMFLVLLLYLLNIRKRQILAVRTLFFGTALWAMLCLAFFINKIERISQYAAVEFFTEQSDAMVYVTTYGYKSYVPWFYAKIQPDRHPQANEKEWLYHGHIDRPVMISTKITKVSKLEQDIPDAEFLYAKNGFYFYRRTPDK